MSAPPRPFPYAAGLLRRTARALLLAAALLAAAQPAPALPRLTEFLADNQDALRDEDGDASDFIEIYNPDPQPCNLLGYRLTDDPADSQRWVFPSLVLQPGAYHLIWASGKDRRAPKLPLHTNFRLERRGGFLALFPPNGDTPLSSFAPYPEQFPDRSYGLYQAEISSTLLAPGAPGRALVPTGPLPGWQNPAFDDRSWPLAHTGIGYDRDGPDGPYTPLLGPGGDLAAAMFEQNATAYLRLPFTVADRRSLSGLVLHLQCDDGFIAWLNGARIASRYAPETPAWDSAATAFHDDDASLAFEAIPLPDALGSLRDGPNLLAIQALNGSPDSVDLLLRPRLELLTLNPAQSPQIGYFAQPSPRAANPIAEDGFTDAPQFSAPRGLFRSPFALALTCPTPGATIYYTTDGSTPLPRTARIYTAPLAISTTTVVRAFADADARHPSPVLTHSYLFPADVIRQSAPPNYPSTWGTEDNGFGSLIPVPADYAMDQTVVDDPPYRGLTELALRESLPILSLSTDQAPLFQADGLYADGRYGSAELPVSLEFLGPGWPESIQQNAGLRIHGGNARDHPKKPFRLYFRKAYGTDKLRYPLFENSPVQAFDQLVLRPGGHDGWAVPFGNQSSLLAAHATYLKDQFLRQAETDMGRLSPRGRYVHLYLNGLYWGLYDLHERPNADFYAAHSGGNPQDWDVLHHPTYTGETYTQVDGDASAWDQVQHLADGGIQSDADYQALAALLDIDDYIDHLIVRIWSGDYDWCGPIYLKNGSQEAAVDYFDNKNWYAARRSRGQPDRFRLHIWDAEMSFGSHLMLNLGLGYQPPWLPYYPPQHLAGFDSTRVGTPGSPTWPYAALRTYPPFQQKFGDHLQRHFFNQGQLTTAHNTARLDALAAQLDLPLVAESARWGDVNRFNPLNLALTRNTHWRPEIKWLRDTFIATRNALVLQQFQSIALFPALPAPQIAPDRGTLPLGSPLLLSHPLPTAQLFYTLDGSDPSTFTPASRRPLIEEGAPCTWWVPTTSIGTSWRSLTGPSNPQVWRPGQNGLGYDQQGDYLPHFLTDVSNPMRGFRPSIYIRLEFSLPSQSEIDALTQLILEAKYDDGFIAALNGTVVQRANAPASETFAASATTSHDDSSAIIFTPFTLDAATVRPLLRVGRNVLALQGLNQTAASSDFLCTVRLIAQTGGTFSPSPSAQLYDPAQPPLLTGLTTVKARARSLLAWSALAEAQFPTAYPPSPQNLVLSKIHYHPTDPTDLERAAGFSQSSDFEFLELLNPSPFPVSLSGCRFTSGITFAFDSPTLQALPPGGRLILAHHPAALAFRSGPLPALVGTFSSSLANRGEHLRLESPDHLPIFDLAFSDEAPWPTAPDGSGPALVLINPRGLHDPANPAHWRPSLAPHGSPGLSDAPDFPHWIGSHPASNPLDDPDGDGASNLLEFAAATLPFDPTSFPTLTITPQEKASLLAFPLNPDAESAALTLEAAPSPSGPWLPPQDLVAGPAPPGFRSYLSPSSTPQRCFRLRASLTP